MSVSQRATSSSGSPAAFEASASALPTALHELKSFQARTATMKGDCLKLAFRPLLRATTNTRSPVFGAATQFRSLHKTRPAPLVPEPRPFVPDVKTFLTLIGRGLSKHASKFPTWESLFSMTSIQLKELGIEPPRNRRYLLQWMQKYRKGVLGPGGDLQFVEDGAALLRIARPTAGTLAPASTLPNMGAWSPPGTLSQKVYVVNVPIPPGFLAAADAASAEAGSAEGEATEEMQAATPEILDPEPSGMLLRPRGYKVQGLNAIAGPYARPLPKDGGALVQVTEGMWEDKRGRKIDGGERRRSEIRFKRRSAERRAEREAELLANL